MPQTGSPFEWRKRKFTVSLVNWSGYLSLREKLSWVHWETHHKEISGEKIQHRLVCGGPRGQPRDRRGVGFSLVDEWLRQTGRLGVQALETPKDPIQATSWNMVSLHTPGHKHRRPTQQKVTFSQFWRQVVVSTLLPACKQPSSQWTHRGFPQRRAHTREVSPPPPLLIRPPILSD